MKDMTNKEIRKALIEKYLNAETSPAEEKRLADYYLHHKADEDEQAVVRMIGLERSNAHLFSDEGTKIFDQLLEGKKKVRRPTFIRRLAWAGSIAAMVALCLTLYPTRKETIPFKTEEITQSLRQLIELETDDIVSITATPIDECVWLKAELKDGSTKTFIMSKDAELGTTSLLAIN